MSTATHQKTGRPSKGDRDLILSRPSHELGQVVRERARAEGYDSISEYVATVLADHEGMSDLIVRHKTIRPRRSPRDLIASRVPLELGQVVRERARAEGYDSISEYVTAVLAVHEGMPEQAPEPVALPQREELNLGA